MADLDTTIGPERPVAVPESSIDVPELDVSIEVGVDAVSAGSSLHGLAHLSNHGRGLDRIRERRSVARSTRKADQLFGTQLTIRRLASCLSTRGTNQSGRSLWQEKLSPILGCQRLRFSHERNLGVLVKR